MDENRRFDVSVDTSDYPYPMRMMRGCVGDELLRGFVVVRGGRGIVGHDGLVSEWTNEDRAAARAFLQRSEVRLSTLHRVATALLSGAGLMVLLPAIVKDQVVGVLHTLVTAPASLSHAFLTAAAVTVLAVPLVVLFLLLGDLTRFYFHAQHVPSTGAPAFAPRFTLTGLRLPSGELSVAADSDLATARLSDSTIELLIPSNNSARAAIDRKLDAYGGLNRDASPGDRGRVDGMLELVAARSRPLAEEVAKVEAGMARHLLRLQVIVMRYVKALLAFLTTALAVFAAAAVTSDNPTLDPVHEVWLIVIFAVWAPAIVAAVSSPVRWLTALLRSEGSTVNSVAADPEFTRIERITIVAAAVVWLLAGGAAISIAVNEHPGRGALVTMLVCLAVTALAGGLATARSIATPTTRRTNP